eukprot:6179650-Pleurochrysis_carterae.AAC.4
MKADAAGIAKSCCTSELSAHVAPRFRNPTRFVAGIREIVRTSAAASASAPSQDFVSASCAESEAWSELRLQSVILKSSERNDSRTARPEAVSTKLVEDAAAGAAGEGAA